MHGYQAEGEAGGRLYDRRLMARFLAFLHPYRLLTAATLGLLPLVAAAKLLQPYVVKLAIDAHILKGQMQGLPLLAFLFLLLLTADSLFTYLEVYLLQQIGQHIMHDLRMKLFAHLQRLSSSFFDRTATGATVTRLTSDVEVLGEMFAAGVITIVGDILVIAGIIGIMLWMNLRLSLVAFSVLPLLLWMVFWLRRVMRRAFREVRSRLSELNSALAETVGGMTVIQLFGREEREKTLFGALNAGYRNANLPVITCDAALFAFVEMLSSVAGGLILWYGGGEIVRGSLTFGELVAFIQYSEKFFGPVRDLSGKFSVLQGGMAALERIFALLDRREALPADDGIDPGPVETIDFRNVWFAYEGEDYVLRDFSLNVRRGEKIALVGETGGGKSTVTRLLARLYDVSRGSITINGIDIRRMPPELLRRRIGMVLQDPYLFTGSIRYNISLNDRDALARVEKAAAAVGADRFIARLPAGFDHAVGERGGNLSAGERQLLSFARAVAHDPEVLVLDEATSSIDTGSERIIEEGLRGLLQGRTSLVVAHRLSTVRDADRIVVIHHGEKREEGSHAELLRQGGIYSRLYELQFRS